MIIFGSSISPFVRKTLAFAAEKGIAVDNVPTRIADDNPDFRAASPFRKMPALQDGDYRLADSSAICHYLDALKPDPALIPADPRLRGKVVWFDEFADTLLFACGAKMFFNRIIAPRFLGREGDLAAADAAEHEELPPLLDYLEGQVPDSGFLVGDRLTLADIAVASPFGNFRMLEVDIDSARHPKLHDYVRRMLARPSFAEQLAGNMAFLAQTAAPA